jgi:hypothetical protein
MASERPAKAPLALAVGFTLQALCAGTTMAAWEFVPDVALTTQVNDNPRRLESSPEDPSGRQVLDARARFANVGPRATVFVEPRVATDAYTEESDDELQNDDWFLLGAANYRFPSAQIGMQADYRQQSVLRSEIGAALPDGVDDPDPIDDGTGTRGTLTAQRQHFNFRVNGNFTVSQQTDLRLEASRIDVHYSESDDIARTDFDDTSLTATLSRQVDERNRVSALMYFSQYAAVDNDNLTDSFGVRASFDRPLTQAWDIMINAGLVRADYQFVNAGGSIVANATNNFVFAGGLSRRAEATLWTFNLGRDVSPNANGFLSQIENLTFRVRHQFSERLMGSVGLRAARFQTTTEEAPDDGRSYLRATFQIEWFLTERWRLTGGWDSIEERIVAADRDANTNILSIGLRYRGLSREFGNPFDTQFGSGPSRSGSQ